MKSRKINQKTKIRSYYSIILMLDIVRTFFLMLSNTQAYWPDSGFLTTTWSSQWFTIGESSYCNVALHRIQRSTIILYNIIVSSRWFTNKVNQIHNEQCIKIYIQRKGSKVISISYSQFGKLSLPFMHFKNQFRIWVAYTHTVQLSV